MGALDIFRKWAAPFGKKGERRWWVLINFVQYRFGAQRLGAYQVGERLCAHRLGAYQVDAKKHIFHDQVDVHQVDAPTLYAPSRYCTKLKFYQAWLANWTDVQIGHNISTQIFSCDIV